MYVDCHAAKKRARGVSDISGDLLRRGSRLRAAGRANLVDEIPEAYKDVRDVVKVVEQARIGKIVARLKPLAVIKGQRRSVSRPSWGRRPRSVDSRSR